MFTGLSVFSLTPFMDEHMDFSAFGHYKSLNVVY
jgi:hypothetical protein